jgi:hypothetical protein
MAYSGSLESLFADGVWPIASRGVVCAAGVTVLAAGCGRTRFAGVLGFLTTRLTGFGVVFPRVAGAACGDLAVDALGVAATGGCELCDGASVGGGWTTCFGCRAGVDTGCGFGAGAGAGVGAGSGRGMGVDVVGTVTVIGPGGLSARDGAARNPTAARMANVAAACPTRDVTSRYANSRSLTSSP